MVHRIVRRNGQRIAWANTSRIPDAEIVEAIKFVADEADLDGVVVHVKGLGDRARRLGRAYSHVPSIANLDGLKRREWRYLIIVAERGEQLTARAVNTLAHEAKHVEQFRRGTFRRERKARHAETQCNAFGAWVQERWVASRQR